MHVTFLLESVLEKPSRTKATSGTDDRGVFCRGDGTLFSCTVCRPTVRNTHINLDVERRPGKGGPFRFERELVVHPTLSSFFWASVSSFET